MKIQENWQLNVYAVVEMYQTATQFQFTADILQSPIIKAIWDQEID